MYEYLACICLCATCMPVAGESQKRASHPLELKLPVLVTYPTRVMGWEPNRTSGRAGSALTEPSLQSVFVWLVFEVRICVSLAG